jgi:hypothetical protein
VVTPARNVRLQMGCASSVTQKDRNGKHFLSSEFWKEIMGNRLTNQTSYVRALEMQQFKLVAGLQTMYTMLLAANSWPGPQLTEHKGNPLAHDILDRLGLLEHEKTRISDLELSGYSSDHQSTSDTASTINSPDRMTRGMEQSPKSRPMDSTSTPRASLQQHLSPQANDLGSNVDTWRPQSTQSHVFPAPFIPSPLPTASDPEPYLGTTIPLLNTILIAQGVEATNWSAMEYSAAWWYGNFPTTHETPHLSISPTTVDFTPNTALGGSISSTTRD